MVMRRDCNKCKGTGHTGSRMFRKPCDVCQGKGYVELGNVIGIPVGPATVGIADEVLRDAMGQLDAVVIVGYDKEGNEYYHSNLDDGASALWHLQRGAHNLLTIVDKLEE